MRKLIDIVQTGHEPLTLPPAARVQDACKEMSDRHVDTVLVTDELGSLLGIFTKGDAVNRVLAGGKSAAELTLGEVMTGDPITMSADKTAIEALRPMWDGGFRHVPVTKGGKVIGCVSRADFQGDERETHEHERGLWEHMR